MGGDEFVIFATGLAGSADAAVLADRVLTALAPPISVAGLDVVVTASIGIALVMDVAVTADHLLRRADVAMYRAKARGRNRWELDDPAHQDPAMDQLRLVADLRAGIARDELRVHYQPRVELATGRVVGVEALVRWQHPERGLLPPAAFVETAENSGLIRELGLWVLRAACRQGVAWHEAAPDAPPLEIAVNLSARQLADPRLPALVESVLEETGLDPSTLVLEMTETALMADADAALGALRALRSLGLRLAIDDFGTGYSSLVYLKRFPVNELKIDRSFVEGLGSDPEDTAIVTSVIELAHAVGIQAVAEGVETEEQWRALLTLGCDLAQGYLFARPLPADEVPLAGAAPVVLP
jgi:EAL domain-containing protein (putative c-di-GMP-specific phosphodiesterase class I)